MFRLALLSVVVALAVGQNADLLCNLWCHPTEAAGCHHRDSATPSGVKGDDTCSNDVLSVTTFIGEDVRRAAPGPDAQQAAPVPRYQFSPSTTETRARGDSARERSLDKRPLTTTLRI
jgi:hypothetical protein